RAAPGEAGVTAVAAGTKVGGGNHNGHPSIVGSGPAGGAARRAGRDQAGEPNPKSEARNPKQAPNRNTEIRNPVFFLRTLNLFRISSFGFRISANRRSRWAGSLADSGSRKGRS